MMTPSNGNIFRVIGSLCGEFTGEFPAQRPATRSFDVFFDLRLNKRLSKQSWGWWFETPSRSLWRHSMIMFIWIFMPWFHMILLVIWGPGGYDPIKYSKVEGQLPWELNLISRDALDSSTSPINILRRFCERVQHEVVIKIRHAKMVTKLLTHWPQRDATVINYRKISNITRTKSQNLNDSHLVLELFLPNPLKLGVKSRMKM